MMLKEARKARHTAAIVRLKYAMSYFSSGLEKNNQFIQ
jgi:hypothetical protein